MASAAGVNKSEERGQGCDAVAPSCPTALWPENRPPPWPAVFGFRCVQNQKPQLCMFRTTALLGFMAP